jgi:hypothetical protein
MSAPIVIETTAKVLKTRQAIPLTIRISVEGDKGITLVSSNGQKSDALHIFTKQHVNLATLDNPNPTGDQYEQSFNEALEVLRSSPDLLASLTANTQAATVLLAAKADGTGHFTTEQFSVMVADWYAKTSLDLVAEVQRQAALTQKKAEDTKYNGWKNRATWNVALWIGNDEGLYNLAKECRDYADFVRKIGGGKTPDGFCWNGKALDRKALNEVIREIRGIEAPARKPLTR